MKIVLKEAFKMSVEEKAYLSNLPANLPDVKIKEQDKDVIGKLYRKYITRIDNYDYSYALFELEKKENWPSGNRMKAHESQRIILGFLSGFRDEIELQMIFGSLTNRESYRKLLKNAYELTD